MSAGSSLLVLGMSPGSSLHVLGMSPGSLLGMSLVVHYMNWEFHYMY